MPVCGKIIKNGGNIVASNGVNNELGKVHYNILAHNTSLNPKIGVNKTEHVISDMDSV